MFSLAKWSVVEVIASWRLMQAWLPGRPRFAS